MTTRFRWETEFKETEIGEIPRDWEVETLSWAVKNLESGNRPKGGILKRDPTGILSIGGENITWQGDLILDNCLRFSKEFYESLTKGKIEKEDILLVKDGATIGKLVFIKEIPEGKAMVNEHVFLIKTDKEKYDPRYLFYYLFSEIGQSFIESSISGSAQGGINKSILDTVKIPKLNLPEQNRIATVLSWFDDLIENKKRQNEILEKTAMAIFKNWFIDFEPFKDGEFIDSELGKIPKGWDVKKISELIDDVFSGDWGKDEPTREYNEKVYCIRGTDIPELNKRDFINLTLRFLKRNTVIKKSLKHEDIIIEISGGSFDQQTGRVLLVSSKLLDSYDLPVICSNFCKVIRSKYPNFLILLFKYFYSIGLFYEYESGTTSIKNLDVTSLFNLKIPFPNAKILQKFHSLVEPLFQKIILNQKQIMLLRKIRDKLLPLLVFGKLRVGEV